MAEHIILDHEAAECAVIVDLDNLRPLPIIAVGPNRRAILQDFIDRTPFDVGLIDDETMRAVFVDFLESSPEFLTAAIPDDATAPVVVGDGEGSDDGAALAEAEAHNAGTEPEPQPADTDMEADAGEAPAPVTCWNCNGVGTVSFGEGEPAQTCNMCKGSGRVTVGAAA